MQRKVFLITFLLTLALSLKMSSSGLAQQCPGGYTITQGQAPSSCPAGLTKFTTRCGICPNGYGPSGDSCAPVCNSRYFYTVGSNCEMRNWNRPAYTVADRPKCESEWGSGMCPIVGSGNNRMVVPYCYYGFRPDSTVGCTADLSRPDCTRYGLVNINLNYNCGRPTNTVQPTQITGFVCAPGTTSYIGQCYSPCATGVLQGNICCSK